MLSQLFQLFSVKSQIESSRKKLYQAAYSWCHERNLAEDLAQDVLLKALSSKAEIKNIKFLDTWLFRILINTWHDYLKAKKDIDDLDNYVFLSPDDIEHDYLSSELATKVRLEISKLPLNLREVITLSDFSGFSYQEIADIVGVPIGTIMSRLFRARKILEDKLKVTEHKPSEVLYLRKVL